MSSDIPQLPNPFTPMAFLPPDVAYEVTITTYVVVGSLSACILFGWQLDRLLTRIFYTQALIWDILSNLKADYMMLSRGPIRLPLATYFVSRLGSLGCLTAIAITETSPIGNCEHIRGLQSLYLFAIPPSLLLFLFRIRALYHDNRYVQAFFFIMWLTVLGADVTPMFGASGGHIGNTNYCLDAHLQPYTFMTCLIPLVNDSLIFVATAWKLMQIAPHTEQNLRNGMRVMLFGDYLPAFSRSIMQDGQLYFLTTLGLNFLTAVLFFIPTVPFVYRSFIGIPAIVLVNSMACHVFRKIRLGMYKEATILPTVNLGIKEGSINPISALVFNKDTKKTDPSPTSSVEIASQPIDPVIVITKEEARPSEA